MASQRPNDAGYNWGQQSQPDRPALYAGYPVYAQLQHYSQQSQPESPPPPYRPPSYPFLAQNPPMQQLPQQQPFYPTQQLPPNFRRVGPPQGFPPAGYPQAMYPQAQPQLAYPQAPPQLQSMYPQATSQAPFPVNSAMPYQLQPQPQPSHSPYMQPQAHPQQVSPYMQNPGHSQQAHSPYIQPQLQSQQAHSPYMQPQVHSQQSHSPYMQPPSPYLTSTSFGFHEDAQNRLRHSGSLPPVGDVRQRYLQQYNQFQQITQQFNAPTRPLQRSQTLPPPQALPSSPSPSLHSPLTTRVEKEGFLQYEIIGIVTRRWFVLHSDGILIGYSDIEHSHEIGEPIDLKQYTIEVANANQQKHKYSFSLVSVEDKTFRLEFIAASCKEAVEWLVSVGQKSANFSVLKEQEMVNTMLEQFEEEETAKRPVSASTTSSTRKRSSSFKSYLKAKFDNTEKRGEKKWIEEMKAQPENKSLAVNYLLDIYEKTVHPLGQLVAECKDSLKALVDEATIDDLPKIADEIRFCAERVCTNSVVQYRDLAMNPTLDEYCTTAFYEAVFPTIYAQIFALYKSKCSEEDITHSKKVGAFLTISPGHLAIKKKFWLTWSDGSLPDDLDLVKPAYHVAITTLKKLPSYQTPSRKVSCLVATANAIVEAVQAHFKGSQEDDIAVSADDLLPILTYVMIKANVPNICSELAFVNDFLSDMEARSMEGYTLVTAQTSELSQNAAQLFEKIAMEQNLKGSTQDLRSSTHDLANGQDLTSSMQKLDLTNSPNISGEVNGEVASEGGVASQQAPPNSPPSLRDSITLINWDSVNT